MPLVAAASNAARKSDAAPKIDPIPKFLSQPRCGKQPSARNGNPSSSAPQAQPASVAENKSDPELVTNHQLLLSICELERWSTRLRLANDKAWLTSTQILKATMKIARRQPLRR